MKKRRQIQQGDVTIETTKIPSGAKPKDGLILAYGEVSNHSHRVFPAKNATAEMLELGQQLFLRIQGGDCRVLHEEHKEITLPPGEYEIARVLEYDYEKEEARQVQD